MKKSVILFGLIIIIVLVVIGVYYYLTVERKIRIYKEYRVYSGKETGGIAWFIITSEETRRLLMQDYNIKMPEIDFNEYYLLWSSGRRIKAIRYRIISKYKWRYGVPKGIALFEEKYYPHTAFFYAINKIHLKQDWERFEELEKEVEKIRQKK